MDMPKNEAIGVATLGEKLRFRRPPSAGMDCITLPQGLQTEYFARGLKLRHGLYVQAPNDASVEQFRFAGCPRTFATVGPNGIVSSHTGGIISPVAKPAR